MNENIVIWEGPFAWPGYESITGLPKLPEESGVYLQTFKYNEGYLIYCAGLTRRNVSVRFKEHTKKYLNGEYTILDIDAVARGSRKEIWHGWDYAKAHRVEFEEKRIQLIEAVKKQLSAFQIFVANLDNMERRHERLEAAIMNTLLSQPSPVGSLPDQGMHLSPRNINEPPISLQNISKSVLIGLPNTMEI